MIDTCDATDRQDWNIIIFPNSGGDFLIQNHLTGACLSILNNNPKKGAQVNTHSCNFSGGDLFEVWFQRSNEITNVGDNGLAVQPSGCGAANDLPIFMNDFNHCLADQWRFPGD